MFVLLLVMLSITLNLILTFRYAWTNPSSTRNALIKISLGLFSLVWSLIAVEGFFRVFVLYPDGFAYTLASRNWEDEYWKPTNSFGYRDIEHDLKNLATRKKLFVVGDSFVAGQGIDNPLDRFSDVLADRLGDQWKIFNIAQSGWNTEDEFKALRDHPILPDIIVLSYFINDIDGAALRVRKQDPPEWIDQPSWLIRSLVNKSHLFNFFYWRVYRFHNAEEMATTYLTFLEKAFNDPKVWLAHEQELLRLVDWAESKAIKTLVVVFPALVDLDWSRPFTRKVVQLLHKRGLPVIDLSEKLIGRNPRELVVNKFDAHPNVKIHKEVAGLILSKLKHSAYIQEP